VWKANIDGMRTSTVTFKRIKAERMEKERESKKGQRERVRGKGEGMGGRQK
jgi:hypothetical protein